MIINKNIAKYHMQFSNRKLLIAHNIFIVDGNFSEILYKFLISITNF